MVIFVTLLVLIVIALWQVGFFYYLGSLGYVAAGGKNYGVRKIELFGDNTKPNLHRGVLAFIKNKSVYVWGMGGLRSFSISESTFISYVDVCNEERNIISMVPKNKTKSLKELPFFAKSGDTVILLLVPVELSRNYNSVKELWVVNHKPYWKSNNRKCID